MFHFHRPSVETLEDRITPSSIWGTPWPDPGHLTLSFVPDGTMGAIGASNLFQTLNSVAPTASWELEVLRAFQTWAVNANINVAVVPDGGQPLGIAGAVQGDSRFGDSRISGTPGIFTAADVADSTPFSWTGSTWSGDVVLNTNYPFAIGNQTGQYDLFSVMLHEAGHVFGFGDSTDTSSVMDDAYMYRTQLPASDIAALQALYGVRQQDTQNNGSIGTATSLPLSLQGGTTSADISSLSDVDYYRIQTPGFLTGFTSFSVQVKTSDISLLMPSLSVYNSSGHQVAASVASDPLHGDLTVTVNASPSSTYYIRVGNDTSTVFGIGGYQLNVTNHYGLISLGNILNTSTTLLNDTLGTALHLTSQNPGTDQRFDYFTQGDLLSSNGGLYYLVQAPANTTGAAENMAAIAWGTDVNSLQPRVHFFDAKDNPLPVQVVANDAGTYTIQMPNVTPGASYYVEVVAENPADSGHNTGHFDLGVDFHVPALVAFDNLASGSVSAGQSVNDTLTANIDQLFHFALSATSSNAKAWVTMTVLDSTGAVVVSVSVQANQPTVTADLYLKKGTYTVRYSGYTSDGSAWNDLSYQLSGGAFSDPVGSYPTSPSSPPSSSPSGSTSTTTTTSSPPPSSSYSGSSGTTSTTQTSPSSSPYYY